MPLILFILECNKPIQLFRLTPNGTYYKLLQRLRRWGCVAVASRVRLCMLRPSIDVKYAQPLVAKKVIVDIKWQFSLTLHFFIQKYLLDELQMKVYSELEDTGSWKFKNQFDNKDFFFFQLQIGSKPGNNYIYSSKIYKKIECSMQYIYGVAYCLLC